MRMIKFGMWAFVLQHWAACGWAATATVVNTVAMPDGTVVPADDSWIVQHGFSEADHAQVYVAAFYWAMQTLATVGYGDVSCHS